MMGRIIGWAVSLTIFFAFAYLLAGAAVMAMLAGNSGNAVGAGARGTLTFGSAMGNGWREADTMQARIDAADAQKRQADAEKKLKATQEKLRQAQKRAQGGQ